MALPVSPNPISFNNVNQELGRQSPYNQTVALNDGVVRTLFQRTTAGSSVAMSDGWGKSNVSAPTITAFTGSVDSYESGSGMAYAQASLSSNRSIYAHKQFYASDYNVASSASGGSSIGFTVSGGNLTYEWQYLSHYGILNTTNCTPKAYNAFSFNGDYVGYTDIISGGNTATLTFSSVYGYYGRSGYIGVDGYWRLKASNSAGEIYSTWIKVIKNWGAYTYDCNCTCPCGNTEYSCICNCDENNENCTGCCDYYCTCTSCDTCTGYYDQSWGYYNNWCP